MKKIIVLLVLCSFLSTQVGLGMPKEGLRNARDVEKKPFAGSGAAGTFGAYFAKVNKILTVARDPDKPLPERLDAVKQLEDAKAADALRTLAFVLEDDDDKDDKEVRSAAQQALDRIADSDRAAAEQARASATAGGQGEEIEPKTGRDGEGKEGKHDGLLSLAKAESTELPEFENAVTWLAENGTLQDLTSVQSAIDGRRRNKVFLSPADTVKLGFVAGKIERLEVATAARQDVMAHIMNLTTIAEQPGTPQDLIKAVEEIGDTEGAAMLRKIKAKLVKMIASAAEAARPEDPMFAPFRADAPRPVSMHREEAVLNAVNTILAEQPAAGAAAAIRHLPEEPPPMTHEEIAEGAHTFAMEIFGTEGTVEEFMMLDPAEARKQIEEFRKAADAILAKPKEHWEEADKAMAEAIGSSLEIFAEGRARTARGLKPGEKLPEKNGKIVYAFLGGKKTAALMRQVAIDYLCVDFDMKTEGETTEAKIKNRMTEEGIDVDSVGQVICVSPYELTEEERRLLNRTGEEDRHFSNMFLPESFFKDENTLYTTLNRSFDIPIPDTPAAKAAAWTAFKAEQLRHEV